MNKLHRVLIVDTETQGVDSTKDLVVEVGAVLFNVEHACVLECYSSLMRADSNAAESINRIPAKVLYDMGAPRDDAWKRIEAMSFMADAYVAHSADFDKLFFPPDLASKLPWIDTQDDLIWPKSSNSTSLVSLALAHGLGVSSAHRALTDRLLIARLFERVHEMGVDLQAMLQRGFRPKAKFAALTASSTLPKEHGFRYNGKMWTRSMAIEDAAALPFKTKQL